MRFKPYLFTCLDLVNLLFSLAFLILLGTLFISSIIRKLSDCDGFTTICTKLETVPYTLGKLNSTQVLERLASKDFTALLTLYLHKWNLTLKSRQTDEEEGKFDNKLNYDWITIDQYVLFLTTALLIVFGCAFCLARKRNLIFVTLLFYLQQSIQVILIEASDDRDFPISIFRDGYTLSRYSLIYTDNTTLYLVAKIIFIAFSFVYFLLLNLNFVLLRYLELFEKLNQNNGSSTTRLVKVSQTSNTKNQKNPITDSKPRTAATGVGGMTRENFRKNHIDFVANITIEAPAWENVDGLRLPLEDDPNANILPHLDIAIDRIQEAITKRNAHVLVHCVAGVSRSATVVIAYLMKYRKMDLKTAFNFCYNLRPVIRPNNGFMQQLINYEMQLFGRNSTHMVSAEVDDITVHLPHFFIEQHPNLVMLEVMRVREQKNQTANKTERDENT